MNNISNQSEYILMVQCLLLSEMDMATRIQTLNESVCSSIVMLAKERHGEHKKLDRKTYIFKYRNKIQVNLVKK